MNRRLGLRESHEHRDKNFEGAGNKHEGGYEEALAPVKEGLHR